MQGKNVKRYILAAYLIFICTFLPIYMKDGYFELGEAKGLAFMVISAVFIPVILISGGGIKKLFVKDKGFGLAEFSFFAFLFSNIITLVFSVDEATAFFGLRGWRNGALTIFLTMFFFVLISKKESVPLGAGLVSALLVVPFFEAALGILGRFRIFPLPGLGGDNSFLATIGNINWYVGFLSVFVPLGVGLSYCRKSFKAVDILMCLYSITSLSALFLQGSESAALVVIGIFVPLLFISLKDVQSFKRFLLQLLILGLSMEVCDLLMYFFGGRYNYEKSILLNICTAHYGLVCIALAIFLNNLIRLLGHFKGRWRADLYRKIMLGVLVIAASGFAISVAESLDLSSGNGRGLIFSISADMFAKMSPVRQLFGVGQDCFMTYAYSDPEIKAQLLSVFPGNVLTNAHCDLLTILIERGLFGAFSYVLFMGSSLFFLIKNKGESAAVICVLPVISYLLNSLVSFQSPVSTPYMFMALAMGLSFISAQKS